MRIFRRQKLEKQKYAEWRGATPRSSVGQRSFQNVLQDLAFPGERMGNGVKSNDITLLVGMRDMGGEQRQGNLQGISSPFLVWQV
jgi:hypothetical protein